MSFNVRGSYHDAGTPNAWPERAALNVETVRRCAPDVIGFQELQSGNLATYARTLPRYSRVLGPEYGNPSRPSWNAIYFDPERLRLVDSGGFWLSETPQRRSSSWDSRVVRSATWALLELGDLTLLHLNTHLDHVSKSARVEGGRLILRKIARLLARHADEIPVILTGDFNCRPGSPTYLAFLDAGFEDTHLTAEDREVAHTFHRFEGTGYRDARSRLGPRRIDWILVRDPRGRLRPQAHRIVRDHAGKTYPSDHYPVLADLAPWGDDR